VFNSIGIAFGSLIVYSSYNRFHGPIMRNTLIVAGVDAITCIICGVVVFATMGNLAYERGLDSVEDVVVDGPGLVFVVFPHALSKLPLPQGRKLPNLRKSIY
jgi:solute carrier family 6 GABA transporter-like protein 6/8/11/12/13